MGTARTQTDTVEEFDFSGRTLLRYRALSDLVSPQTRRVPVPLRDLWRLIPDSRERRSLSVRDALAIIGDEVNTNRVKRFVRIASQSLGREVPRRGRALTWEELLGVVRDESRLAARDRRHTVTYGLRREAVAKRLLYFQRCIDLRRKIWLELADVDNPIVLLGMTRRTNTDRR